MNYCHYACGSTKVTVRSIHIMYRHSPSNPTICNYHPSTLIILIPPHNVIAVQHKQKDRHQTLPCHCTVTLRSAPEAQLKTDCVSKCRIYLGHRYANMHLGIANIYCCVSGRNLLQGDRFKKNSIFSKSYQGINLFL